MLTCLSKYMTQKSNLKQKQHRREFYFHMTQICLVYGSFTESYCYVLYLVLVLSYAMYLFMYCTSCYDYCFYKQTSFSFSSICSKCTLIKSKNINFTDVLIERFFSFSHTPTIMITFPLIHLSFRFFGTKSLCKFVFL